MLRADCRRPPFSRSRERGSSPARLTRLLLPLLAALAGCSTSPTALRPASMRVQTDASNGQVTLWEGERPILQYHHQAHTPWPSLDAIAEGNRIYARPRANYIDPLFGPAGESLTCDGPVDHPHHRGIYWAWPEVMFGNELGDLHALQRVFAHPEGGARTTASRDTCTFRAVQLWKWDHQQPIVREEVTVVAHRSSGRGRSVDLEFRFEGLADGVSIARRGTRLYGGLNVRLNTPRDQSLATHTDPPGAVPRRTWSDLSGVFAGSEASGISILQHPTNPEYPGDWVQYPEISWCQPTFPAAGTRWPLPRGGPALVLRYRLWIHRGVGPSPDEAAALWDAYARPRSPAPRGRVALPSR